MRIISGIYKSRKIKAPKQLPVRPTTDMAKESLFNILNNLYYFDDIRVLDLFAGTGNISYEFASRGTKDITCVDAHLGCVKFIETTAQQFEMPIVSIKKDVYKFLETAGNTYDIIFADPPYSFSDAEFTEISNLVFKNNILEPEGILIVEHSKHTDLSQVAYFSYAKNYGGSVFSFFEIIEKNKAL